MDCINRQRTITYLISICLSFAILSAKNSLAQNSDGLTYPVVGQKCPNFLFHSINNMRKKNIKNKDFLGKWLVLDFWSKGCSACFDQMPRYDSMARDFKNVANFLTVGRDDRRGDIEVIYKRFRMLKKITTHFTFDSTVFLNWNIDFVPYVVVINPFGMVKAVTIDIDSSKFAMLISGKSVGFEVSKNNRKDVERSGTIKSGEKVAKNTDSLTFYGSLINKFDTYSETSRGGLASLKGFTGPSFEVSGVPLTTLFNYAYMGRFILCTGPRDTNYGNVAPRPVLYIKDSSLFRYSYQNNQNIFSYRYINKTGTNSEEILETNLRNDLRQAFGLTASVQIRRVKCWKLILKDSSLNSLKSSGGKSESSGSIKNGLLSCKNTSFKFFYNSLTSCFDNDVILDSTNILKNVDINNFSCNCNTIEDVKPALNSLGLDLSEIWLEMKVLVIQNT